MARPKKNKYIIKNLCKVIDEYIQEKMDAGGLPILKECCLENDLNYDYIIQLQRETKEQGDERLSRSIKKLLGWKEVILERGLVSGKLNTTGCIFVLKQPAHGWTDKHQVEYDDTLINMIKERNEMIKNAIENEDL